MSATSTGHLQIWVVLIREVAGILGDTSKCINMSLQWFSLFNAITPQWLILWSASHRGVCT